MTEDQKRWLAVHIHYTPVRPTSIVQPTGWSNQGWLWADGRFSPDDGGFLFVRPQEQGAIRVGREYGIC